MEDLEKKAEFISACIESYKVRHAASGADVANLFEARGVLDYLADGYDVLHTQSLDYVVDDIEIFIAKRGGR